jgi:HEAT repeat protein
MIDPIWAAEVAFHAEEVLERIEQLKDERGECRLKAANRLQDIGDERAVEPLCAALSDLNPDVRTSAAKALIGIGDTRAVVPLCSTLKDSYRNARICAAEALGHIGDSRAVAPLCGMFRDTYQDVRVSAADALAKIGSPSVASLCDLLKDTDQERPAHGKSSGARSATGPGPNLPLRDVKRSARRLAASSLGTIGDAAAVESLCDALRDVDATVRLAAAGALHKIRDSGAVWALCAALRDSDQQVRSAAARALIEIKHLLAVEPLCRLFKDRDPSVRSSALDALRNFGGTYDLPYKVLSTEALTPKQQLDTLRALSSNWSSFGVKLGRIGNVQTFCEGLCSNSGVDRDVKRGAAAVLHEMKNSAASNQLVRASGRADSVERTELLRGIDGCSNATASSELIRASDNTPEHSVGKKPGILGKLFKK